MNPSLNDLPAHRAGLLRVTARPGTRLQVTQLRHGFELGTAVSPSKLDSTRADPDREPYLKIVGDAFNTVFPGNALKWAHCEPEPGRLRYEDADRCVSWCEAQGYRTRGHCIFYSTDLHIQSWIRELDDRALWRAMEERARGVVGRYRGRIPEWDLSNEMLDDVDWFRQRLGTDVLKAMSDWAREEDPDVVLYLNEHDILTGGDVDRYERLIEELLKLGVAVGGIGCQGHFDYPVDLGHVNEALDRLARYGLPIKITEFDIGIRLKDERLRGVPWIRDSARYKDMDRYREVLAAHGEVYEREKAEALGEAYRLFFAHPAVAGVHMWGFWESEHWRSKGGIFRRDFSPYPSGQAFLDLVRGAWWTDTEVEADAEGRAQLRVALGDYRIEAGGKAEQASLTPEQREQEVRL